VTRDQRVIILPDIKISESFGISCYLIGNGLKESTFYLEDLVYLPGAHGISVRELTGEQKRAEVYRLKLLLGGNYKVLPDVGKVTNITLDNELSKYFSSLTLICKYDRRIVRRAWSKRSLVIGKIFQKGQVFLRERVKDPNGRYRDKEICVGNLFDWEFHQKLLGSFNTMIAELLFVEGKFIVYRVLDSTRKYTLSYHRKLNRPAGGTIYDYECFGNVLRDRQIAVSRFLPVSIPVIAGVVPLEQRDVELKALSKENDIDKVSKLSVHSVLKMSGMNGVSAIEIAHRLVPGVKNYAPIKRQVQIHLYGLLELGIADKMDTKPPRWVVKNVDAGFMWCDYDQLVRSLGMDSCSLDDFGRIKVEYMNNLPLIERDIKNIKCMHDTLSTNQMNMEKFVEALSLFLPIEQKISEKRIYMIVMTHIRSFPHIIPMM